MVDISTRLLQEVETFRLRHRALACFFLPFFILSDFTRKPPKGTNLWLKRKYKNEGPKITQKWWQRKEIRLDTEIFQISNWASTAITRVTAPRMDDFLRQRRGWGLWKLCLEFCSRVYLGRIKQTETECKVNKGCPESHYSNKLNWKRKRSVFYTGAILLHFSALPFPWSYVQDLQAWAGDVAQWFRCLPHRRKVPSLISRLKKKKKDLQATFWDNSF